MMSPVGVQLVPQKIACVLFATRIMPKWKTMLTLRFLPGCPLAKNRCSGAPWSWPPVTGLVETAALGPVGARMLVGVRVGSEQATRARPAAARAARVFWFI